MIDWKIHILLFLLILLIYRIIRFQNPSLETFINHAKQIEQNMNHEHSIENRCDQENPMRTNRLRIYKYKNCMNKYIDLDREILNVPLFLYPSLHFHPMNG